MPNLLDVPLELREMILKEVLANLRAERPVNWEDYGDAEIVEWLNEESDVPIPIDHKDLEEEFSICNQLPPIARVSRQLREELKSALQRLPSYRAVNVLFVSLHSASSTRYAPTWNCPGCALGNDIQLLSFNLELRILSELWEPHPLTSMLRRNRYITPTSDFIHAGGFIDVVVLILKTMIGTQPAIRAGSPQIQTMEILIDLRAMAESLWSTWEAPPIFVWQWLQRLVGYLCVATMPESSLDAFHVSRHDLMFYTAGVGAVADESVTPWYYEEGVQFREHVNEVVIKDSKSQRILFQIQAASGPDRTWSAKPQPRIPDDWKEKGTDDLLDSLTSILDLKADQKQELQDDMSVYSRMKSLVDFVKDRGRSSES